MSIIGEMVTYLKGYSGLVMGAPLWVNHLGGTATQYAILPLPGEKVIEVDILDRKTCEYPFAFQSMESTADDLARLENLGFYEDLAAWFDSQTEAGELPDLGPKKTAIAIEALTWGYIFEQGESQTGVYQVNCRLVYEQTP